MVGENKLSLRKLFYRLSAMETDHDGARRDASTALDTLSADRERLVQRTRVPWSLMTAFGALGGWWVGSAVATEPGARYEPAMDGWMVLVGVLVVFHLVQRQTGIRFGSLGARANWAIMGIGVVWLALFSVSLALVSLDLRWVVGVPSIAAFATTTWLAGVACRMAVEHLRRA